MKKGTNKHSISKWKHKLLIGIITSIICINGANAATNLDLTNYFQAQQLHIDNCANSSSCDIGMNEFNYGSYYTSPVVKLGTSGVYIRYISNIGFKRNQIYSIQNIICFNGSNSLTPNFKVYASDTKFTASTWERQYVNSIGTDFIRDGAYTGETFDICKSVLTMFSPSENTNTIGIHITNPTAVEDIEISHLGYYAESLGVFDQAIVEEISQEINNSGLATATQINEVKSSINTMKSEITSAQQETNNKLEEQMEQDKEQHDEFMNSDLSEEDKQQPNDDGFENYTESENELKDKMNQADLGNVSIGIDANSSSWIWNTLESLIRSHTAVFGMFIAILSIGIIKLALGR